MADEAETHAEGAEYAADAAHGGEAAVGMPQLDFATFPNQIFWLVVALVAIYLILSRVALPRIASVLAARQGTISNHLAAAEDLKRQAAEAEEAYEKALADARARSQEISAQTRAEIQARLDEEIAKADARIAEKTAESQKRIAEIEAQAREVIEQVARDTTGDIVTALGGNADASSVDEAVTARLRGDA